MRVALNTVVHLHRRVPREALEQLNRVTGLQFSNWPESLVAEGLAAPVNATPPASGASAAKVLLAH